MRYVNYKDRKALARDLKPVYRAVNEDDAARALSLFDETWGEQYPMIADSWKSKWEHIVPFLSLPADLRRAVYTTNGIENLNRQTRKTIGKPYNWTGALRGLKIHFGDRLPD